MVNSSDHKRLSVYHRGHKINISYWINYDDGEKIVDWSISGDGYGTLYHGGYVRGNVGGWSGFLGIGSKPERSFHEMIAEAVNKAAEWLNGNAERHEPPAPDEVAEFVEIHGYEAKPEQL